MKYFLSLVLIILLSINFVYGQKSSQEHVRLKRLKLYTTIGVRLLKSGIYFAAIPFFKESLFLSKGRSKKLSKYIDQLIAHVGRAQFEFIPLDVLKKAIYSPFVRFILANGHYKNKRYDLALRYIKSIPKRHLVAPNALMLRGSIFDFKNQYGEALRSFKKCVIKSVKLRKNYAEIPHLKRMYQFIQDSCHISIARVLYKARKYKKAHRFYRSIPKTSYRWPYILLEDAWTSYQLKDYNTTIGRLLTFNSPLLDDYFFPEVEVLKAMSYMDLCLWKDAVATVKHYKKVYTPNGKKLIKFLKRQEKNPYVFVKLAYNHKHPVMKNFKFLQDIVESLKTTPYYVVNTKYFDMMKREYKLLKSRRSSRLVRVLKRNIVRQLKYHGNLLNHYVKKSLYKTANEIIRTSKFLAYIHLDAFSQKKEQIYQSKGKDKRSRGSLKMIKRVTKQYFWMFKDEFWADELGDYVLALESQCRK